MGVKLKKIITALLVTTLILTGCTKDNPQEDLSSGVCTSESSCVVNPRTEIGTQVGYTIDNYLLTTLDGEQVELYDLIQGHDKVIISLEASWCSDCHRQDAKYNQMYNSLPDDVLVIPVFTSYSKEDDPTKTSNLENSRAYMQENGYEFEAYYDVDDVLWKDFDAVGTPTNIVLDGEGVIKAISLEYDLDILLLENTDELEYPVILNE